MRNLLAAAYRRAVHRRLPAWTDASRALADQFKARMAALPPLPDDDASAAGADWLANRRRLRQLVADADPRRFLEWDVLHHTMFVENAAYARAQLQTLRRSPRWADRWRSAIREDAVGLPTRCRWRLSSSDNLITHAYSSAAFERATGRRVDSFGQVIEFGGGYGSMCRLFRRLGFGGEYVIVDFPEFAALQQYYLAAVAAESPAVATGRTVHVTDLADLANVTVADDALLVALWSLSEASLAVRQLALRALDAAPNVLLAYQDRFGEVDNGQFFADWQARRPNVQWVSEPFGFVPGNHYLFGTTAR